MTPIEINYDGTSFIVTNPDRPHRKPLNIGKDCFLSDEFKDLATIEKIILCWFPGKTTYNISPEAKEKLDEILALNQQ